MPRAYYYSIRKESTLTSKNGNQLITLVGTPGAGKSTLAAYTFLRGSLPGTWLYLLNDEGEDNDLLDGLIVQRWAEVLPLGNGCFTCINPEERKELLEAARDLGKNVIFEGMGLVGGTETTHFLEHFVPMGTQWLVVALLDAALFHKNRRKYGDDLIISHLQAATAGIAITKHNPAIQSVDDPRLAEVVEFVMEHAPGKSLFLIQEGGSLPMEIIAFRGGHQGGRHTHEHHVPDASYKQDHHNHAALSYSYRLWPGVNYEMIRSLFTDALCEERGITTVKGSCGGRQFRMDIGEWKRMFDDLRQYVTIYALHGFSPSDVPGFAEVAILQPDRIITGTTSQLLRADVEDANLVRETVAELMREIPAAPLVNRLGRLITHPGKLQELKETARKPAVKPELFGPAIKRCTEYWVLAAKLLWERETLWDVADLANNKRELGISLTWWATYNEADLGPELLRQVVAVFPDRMVFQGFLALTVAHSDEEKGWWLAEEVGVAAKFAMRYFGDSPERRIETQAAFMHVLRHCLSVYREHSAPERAIRHWEEVLGEVGQY